MVDQGHPKMYNEREQERLFTSYEKQKTFIWYFMLVRLKKPKSNRPKHKEKKGSNKSISMD